MRVRRCTTGTRRTPQFSTTVEFHGFGDVTPDGLYARHHLPQYFVRVHDMAPAPVLGESGSKRYYDVWHALGIHTAEPVAEMSAFHLERSKCEGKLRAALADIIPSLQAKEARRIDPTRAGGPWRQRQTDKRPTATPAEAGWRVKGLSSLEREWG